MGCASVLFATASHYCQRILSCTDPFPLRPVLSGMSGGLEPLSLSEIPTLDLNYFRDVEGIL